ncbi:Aldehyde/histidinol dehydrogenase [Ilyonectria robusta]|uniref:Aldehyde/histidinol dehydrogenase n=1 Tax=Ilyonectria robusta TaxID=1079257 RepID=UPI001E8EB2C8|nr:Aldehyde/histidinol dehydrogenase [Ilyonectria robusta]KAH8729306.1 Aldehyde/histidinol dehydrogenase [Ilyonectria robusta]
MTRTFRLAVLECDTPVPPVLEARGTYGEVFRQLLAKGQQGLGPKGSDVQIDISKWDVVANQSFPNVDEIDGLWLSGSKHTSFADDAWIVALVEYVKKVLTTAKIPVVGICFGHQIIGRALGAKVGVSPGGWEISVDKIDLSEEGQKLLGVPSLGLHQMHRDAVLEVPEGLVNLGSSPKCGIQGLYQAGRLISFQAHPEFDGFIMPRILETRHNQKIFDDAMFEDGMARAQEHQDAIPYKMSNAIRTISPSSGEVIFECPGTSVDEARASVDKAHTAFLSYRKTSLDERKAIAVKALDTLAGIKDQLAQELSVQMGRPIKFAGAEIDTMRKRADYLLDIASEALAHLPGQDEPGFRRWISKESVGPVLIVGAWNFPYLITINTLIPALLAGNSVILKPSPQTPQVADRLKEAFDKAGLPADVFQVLHTGSLETVKEIAKLPAIKQICFTGSTAGGLAIREATAGRIVPVNLELGGKDPAYVRADADLKWTAANIVDGAIFNSGQSCCAVERVYVHQDVHDDFVRELQSELEGYKLGDSLDQSTTIGPVISKAAVKSIQAQVDDALRKGAVDATPANASFSTLPQAGSYIAPCLLTNVTHDMSVMTAETFGPLIPVMKVESDEQAVKLMNDSEYGLTASIWTKDIARGEELEADIEAGTVFINRCDCPNPDLAWIGWKNSGLGSTLGPRAFDAFVTMKSHHIRQTHG